MDSARMTGNSGALVLGTILLGMLLFGAVPARGQRFGQWSWEGSAGVSAQSLENLVNDSAVSTYDENRVRLGLGIRGFIVHPAIARFRLAVDALVSRFEGTTSLLDKNRLGYRMDMRLFPFGRMPTDLSFTRQDFDYPETMDEVFLSTTSLASADTTLRAQTRFRTGRLRGTSVGFERTVVDYLSNAARPEIREHQFVNWTRGFGKIQSRAEVRRLFQRFGLSDFEIEDLSATVSEQGRIKDWIWSGSGTATLRTYMVPSLEQFELGSFRVSNRFQRDRQDRDSWSLSYDGELSTRTGLSAVSGHDLTASYTKFFGNGWQVFPTVSYGFQSSEQGTTRFPRLGVGVGRDATLGSVSLRATAAANYSWVDSLGPSGSTSNLGGTLQVSLHQGERSLSRQLDLSWTRNEIRIVDDAVDGAPELEALLAEVLDRTSARLSLNGRWRRITFQSSGEWAQEKTSETASEDFSRDRLTFSNTLSVRRFRFNVGGSSIRSEGSVHQEVRSVGGSMSYSPLQFLTLRMQYQQSFRRLVLGPDVDLTRLTGELEFRLGRFSLTGKYFQLAEQERNGDEVMNRGLSWSISRGFNGWLPIVSAPRRRGFVR